MDIFEDRVRSIAPVAERLAVKLLLSVDNGFPRLGFENQTCNANALTDWASAALSRVVFYWLLRNDNDMFYI